MSKRAKKFEVPYDKKPDSKEDFFERVYDVVRKIPRGRVTSYGAIANYLGGSARVTGWAMNNCHSVKPKVPAHRVVNRNGLLTGKMHFGSPTAMQDLLESEKVKVMDDKVVDFDKLFWDPEEEMKNEE